MAIMMLAFFFVLWIPSPLSAKKITILYSNATFTGTALFVAKDAGFCAPKGIEPELVLGTNSLKRRPLLWSGVMVPVVSE